jgi:hypothetical protein
MYKPKKRHKKHHLGQGKEIILFNTQRLEITTFVGQLSVNLVWTPLDNTPSTPSKFLLSQSIDHLNGRECIVWEKRDREETLRQ